MRPALVAHSLRQMRTMCSKILWLHKGKQVVFGDDVQMLCDAYEEFLKTGTLPNGPEEIEEMAAQTARQRELERRKRTAPKAPKAPKLTIGLTAQGKPRLKWNKVEGAEKYVIYRAVGNGGAYEKIFTTSYLTFSNPSAAPGDICYYKVRALGKGGLSPFSNPEVVISE